MLGLGCPNLYLSLIQIEFRINKPNPSPTRILIGDCSSLIKGQMRLRLLRIKLSKLHPQGTRIMLHPYYRHQNLSQFYFFIYIKLNFILKFKSQLHLNCLILLHLLILSFYYFINYFNFILFLLLLFFLFLFFLPSSLSSLFLFLLILSTPLTPPTHSLFLHV